MITRTFCANKLKPSAFTITVEVPQMDFGLDKAWGGPWAVFNVRPIYNIARQHGI